MPTYEYKCSHCGHEEEVIQKITAEPITLCSACHNETLKRGPGGGVGLSFKGAGFYITDYGKNSACKEGQACCPCKKSEA